jgi:signal transduction histidine kinase
MAPQRFRRRFLVVAVVALAVLVGLGVVIGLGVDRWHGAPTSPAPGTRRGPGGLLLVVGFVALVGGVATALAYKRISRPVADLLGASERLAQGDHGVKVEPDGPRELRSLIDTFNQMAARLDATEEQRRRFLADVTHELRTPLAVLQSGIEAQLDGIHPRDDGHLGSLLEETHILGRLVDDLHTLALADAGRLALHHEMAHPAALVAEAVESHHALAERRGVVVGASVPDDLPEVDVDPTRIRQVLANLLSNAVRHAASSVTVTVALAEAGGAVGFTVVDDGPGFPADQIDGVFERFTRAADSRGSGLGLSIARDLVQAHGGTITASNQAGAGAAIAFTVPVGRAETGGTPG